MTKLRYLKVAGFRGARFGLPLDFTKHHRSIAIFGENAAGKSTITDALEWFIADKVDHLWREDCKQDALRHVLCDELEDSVVEVRFDDEDQASTKTLSAQLNTTTDYANDKVATLIESLNDDHIILRRAKIIDFLDKRKGEKRKAIASIIGYDEINRFREVLQQTGNALQKEPDYTGAKQQSQSLQSKMIEISGEVVANRSLFFEVADKIVEPFELNATILDDASYENALTELQSLVTDIDKIKVAERLKQLEKVCNELAEDIGKLEGQTENFAGDYNDLAQERENVNRLRLSDFLNKGKTVIEEKVFTDPNCPFCLSPNDLSKLQAEVEARLSALAGLQSKLETSREAKDLLLEIVANAERKAKVLAGEYTDLSEFTNLITCANRVTDALRVYYQIVTKKFDALEIFDSPKDFEDLVGEFREQCEASSKQAQEAAEKLDLTEMEKKVFAALSDLESLSALVTEYDKIQKFIEAYEIQIVTLKTLFDNFIPVQNEALQAVLDTISKDVGAFYHALHPEENVDEVCLAMVGEEGVEFEYSFHGNSTHPPHKYLSESHISSIGVVLFLANARIFNAKARFLVLDDIVTSFDTGHRRRLLRLLKDEFSDWQIIIMTHERVWFDLIKKEMAENSWQFYEMHADDVNGILLDQSPATLQAIIEKKKGTENVTNDLRKLLELVLKVVCSSLEVKVAFRYNEFNEKRMPNELLNQLRSTLKDKSPDLAKSQMFSNLASSVLVANLDSHDNPESIVRQDTDLLLEDIEELKSLFTCSDCANAVEATRVVAGSKSISCKCGKTNILWKN